MSKAKYEVTDKNGKWVKDFITYPGAQAYADYLNWEYENNRAAYKAREKQPPVKQEIE